MSPSCFHLAHLSDIHLGPLPKVTTRELFSKRVTGYINWKRHRGKTMGLPGEVDVLKRLLDDLKDRPIDHTALTGDMVNIDTDAEIAQVQHWLDTHFNASQTSLIPGNHDAYVPGALARACVAWAPFFHFENGIGPQHFPTLLRRDFVSLIGISSARATMPFSAQGFFRQKQAEALKVLLDQEKGQCRVVMIHHPPIHKAAPRYKRLKGIDLFQSVIRKCGAELILHGHTHLPTLNWIDDVPVCGVASASQGAGGRKPMANYSLFEIAPCENGFSIGLERRGLSPAHQDVQTLERLKLSP